MPHKSVEQANEIKQLMHKQMSRTEQRTNRLHLHLRSKLKKCNGFTSQNKAKQALTHSIFNFSTDFNAAEETQQTV